MSGRNWSALCLSTFKPPLLEWPWQDEVPFEVLSAVCFIRLPWNRLQIGVSDSEGLIVIASANCMEQGSSLVQEDPTEPCRLL